MTDQATTFDPMDPHGFHAHDEHEGHHIVSLRMLVTVLIALLAFTFLTVAASSFEQWLGLATGAVIPQWVNVTIAMSIAVIKGALVLMFFMQLYYDKPLNTIIFLFCLFAFALFLGLTALDLNSRGAVFDWKQGEIVSGGNSVGLTRKAEGVGMEANQPIHEWARKVGEARAESEDGDGVHHDAGAHAEHSDADQSRPKTGLTPGLFDPPTDDDTHESDADASQDGDAGH